MKRSKKQQKSILTYTDLRLLGFTPQQIKEIKNDIKQRKKEKEQGTFL